MIKELLEESGRSGKDLRLNPTEEDFVEAQGQPGSIENDYMSALREMEP